MDGVRGVLFDLDNTLHDRDASFQAWARWFARERLGIDEAAREAAVVRLVEMDADGYRPRREVFGWLKTEHPILTATVDDLIAAFYQERLAHLSLDDAARSLLDALAAAGIPFGIVTNGSARQMDKIERLGLDGCARCVHVSELAGCRKPEPAIFLAAAADLGLAPRDILFAGDNPEADIAGAAGVGMRTAWLHRGRAWPAQLAATTPDYTIGSLAELSWLVAR